MAIHKHTSTSFFKKASFAFLLTLSSLKASELELSAEERMKSTIFMLEKEAEQNQIDALNTLGVMYLEGTGVPEDKEKAYQLIQRSAAQNNATGQYLLGLCYHIGAGVDENAEAAIAWVTKAAYQGLCEAWLLLHIMKTTYRIQKYGIHNNQVDDEDNNEL